MNLEPDLVALLRRLKLGKVLPTLPDRLALARAQKLDYAAFLTLILADEVQRRDNLALERRLLSAGFEERVTLESVDWSTPIQVDRRHLNELFSLQFLQRKEHVLFIGPVGVGKTFLAQALGAAATRAAHLRPLPPCRPPSPGARPGPRRPQLRSRLPPLPRAGPARAG
jgi:DNA replication protein DnaC